MNKKGLLKVLISFLSIFLVFSCENKGGSASDKFKVDPEPVIEDAIKNKKFLFVIFESADCKYCAKLNREVLNTMDFKQAAIKNNAAIAIVNVYGQRTVMDPETRKKMSEEALALAYRVNGFPTIVVFDPNKNFKQLYNIPGYIPKEDFLNLLEYLSSNCYQKVKYPEFIKKGKQC
ncbi:MAG: peptide permease [Aquificota bacterium]|nr:MAG: peptide permease [Aquificota bacterium]